MAGYSTPVWTDGASPAIDAASLTAMGKGIELAQHPYGVCSTPAATAAKSVNIDYSAHFGALELFAGLTVRVKFTNSNSTANPTLNVNGTGAVPIMSYGTNRAKTWLVGQVIDFVYDGTNWMFAGIDAYTKGQSLSSATAAQIGALTGTTPTTPDEALSQLATGGGSVRIASGTYTGTGASGSANQNTLTFSFSQKVVIVAQDNYYGLNPVAGDAYGWSRSFIWIAGQAYAQVSGSQVFFASAANSLSWYSANPTAQLNENGVTYSYVALG